MRIDIEDIAAGAIGSLLGRLFLFAAAVWMGCMVGAAAIVGGEIIEREGRLPPDLIESAATAPLLLLSSWFLLNAPFLFITLVVFIRNESDSYLVWGIIAAVESLMAMAGYAHDILPSAVPRICAWFIWAVLLTMAGTGIWFMRQWFINQWARELGMLRVEIAQERAAREGREGRDGET